MQIEGLTEGATEGSRGCDVFIRAVWDMRSKPRGSCGVVLLWQELRIMTIAHGTYSAQYDARQKQADEAAASAAAAAEEEEEEEEERR